MMGTEIFKNDAPWAEKLTKTRVQFLLAPTVGKRRCVVSLGQLGVTVGHLGVTIGNHRINIGQFRLTLGHLIDQLRVGKGYLMVTIGHLRFTIGYRSARLS